MRVKNILSSKGDRVVKVMSTDTVRTTLLRLKTHNFGALVVSDDGETVNGIISERDLVRAMVDHGLGLLEMAVGDLMTRDVRTCGPEDDIEDVMDTMTNGRFRHMPVLVDGHLVGVVSIGDLVKHRMRELVDETKALREYVTDYR
ncbi:MAG TPA: CBS domain-containing protein [Acidimicrobiia bacterium]|nr:CBS domain-containing protein [Acidimicrobiia bacterium]